MPPFAPNVVVFKRHKVRKGGKHAGMYHIQAIKGQYNVVSQHTGVPKERLQYKAARKKQKDGKTGYHKIPIKGFMMKYKGK